MWNSPFNCSNKTLTSVVTCIKPCVLNVSKILWYFFMEEVMFFIKEHYGVCVIFVVSLQTYNSAENTITQVWRKKSFLAYYLIWVTWDDSITGRVYSSIYSECLKILWNKNALFSNLGNYHKYVLSSWFHKSFSKQSSRIKGGERLSYMLFLF